MLEITEQRRIHAPIDEVFGLLADFSRAGEWDPGVFTGRRLDVGPIRAGSNFLVVARVMGFPAPMFYTLLDWRPRERLVFEGAALGCRAQDVIEFRPVGGETDVSWTLQFSLTARPAERLLASAIRETGRAALDGLAEHYPQR